MRWSKEEKEELIKWIKHPNFVKCTNQDLSGADLSFTDLDGLDLSNTNFSNACLRYTNFSSTKLNDTIFKNADLRNANFYASDIRDTDFYNVDLRGANLIETPFWTFSAGQHRAVFIPWQGIIQIGCIQHPVDVWLKNYRDIGRREKYSEEEIELYGKFIEMCYKKNDE